MSPAVQHAITELLVRICETSAPTFDEAARGRLIAELWRGAGLDPVTDEVGNVVAELPGGTGSSLLLAAHLDTVFGAEIDVTVHRDGDRLKAPGIGDNSASLAVMSHLAARHRDHPDRPRVTLAATVGEEGLGDLYGIRHLLASRRGGFDRMVALDGHLGTIVSEAVGSKRYEVVLRAQGGHSWGDYPAPSAVHALGDAVAALNRLEVPREPRSSANVGQVAGGTSVNAIAEEARFNLDLRSLDPEVLDRLAAGALERVRGAAREHRVGIEIEQVGDRPVARTDNQALVRAAKIALAGVGVGARTAASSTDANAAMATGIAAIAFGVYRGGDAHRLSEWLEPASLPVGYRALTGLLAALARLG